VTARTDRTRDGAGRLPVSVAVGAIVLSAALLAVGRSPAGAAPAGSARAGTAPASTAPAVCPATTWPLARDAEQTIAVPVEETDVAAVRQQVAGGVGGVVLFGSAAPPGLAEQLHALESVAPGGIDPLVMTDEEGGEVQRMANLVGSVPSARQMGSTMSPAQIEALAEALGRRLLAAGVTMDLAPVLDVDGGAGPDATDADGTRSFSPLEPVASADGLAFARGLESAGVIPVVKHFPGLGGATGNTDLEPASTPPLATLERVGLKPFESAVRAGIPAVMVSNATVPGLTSVPASISHAAIDGLLRGTLHFAGLVVTDSLSVKSLSDIGRSTPSASVSAVASGADLVLFNAGASDVGAVTAGIVQAELAAVAQHRLGAAVLRAAATEVLAAKKVGGCRA
jgi:beta-N-acetylhexosaminidase